MTEKILENKKNGMVVLLLTTLILIASLVLLILGAIEMENENKEARNGR